jgi:hypothetical protein
VTAVQQQRTTPETINENQETKQKQKMTTTTMPTMPQGPAPTARFMRSTASSANAGTLGGTTGGSGGAAVPAPEAVRAVAALSPRARVALEWNATHRDADSGGARVNAPTALLGRSYAGGATTRPLGSPRAPAHAPLMHSYAAMNHRVDVARDPANTFRGATVGMRQLNAVAAVAYGGGTGVSTDYRIDAGPPGGALAPRSAMPVAVTELTTLHHPHLGLLVSAADAAAREGLTSTDTDTLAQPSPRNAVGVVERLLPAKTNVPIEVIQQLVVDAPTAPSRRVVVGDAATLGGNLTPRGRLDSMQSSLVGAQSPRAMNFGARSVAAPSHATPSRNLSSAGGAHQTTLTDRLAEADREAAMPQHLPLTAEVLTLLPHTLTTLPLSAYDDARRSHMHTVVADGAIPDYKSELPQIQRAQRRMDVTLAGGGGGADSPRGSAAGAETTAAGSVAGTRALRHLATSGAVPPLFRSVQSARRALQEEGKYQAMVQRSPRAVAAAVRSLGYNSPRDAAVALERYLGEQAERKKAELDFACRDDPYDIEERETIAQHAAAVEAVKGAAAAAAAAEQERRARRLQHQLQLRSAQGVNGGSALLLARPQPPTTRQKSVTVVDGTGVAGSQTGGAAGGNGGGAGSGRRLVRPGDAQLAALSHILTPEVLYAAADDEALHEAIATSNASPRTSHWARAPHDERSRERTTFQIASTSVNHGYRKGKLQPSLHDKWVGPGPGAYGPSISFLAPTA